MYSVTIPANSAQASEFPIFEANGDGTYILDVELAEHSVDSYLVYNDRNNNNLGFAFGSGQGSAVRLVSLKHGSSVRVYNLYSGDIPEYTVNLRVVRLGND
jgi:hypothetical protein